MKLEDKITELGFTAEQGRAIRDHIIAGNYIPMETFNELNGQFKSLKIEAEDARTRLLGAASDAEKAKNELKQFKIEIKQQEFNRSVDQRILDFAAENGIQWHNPKLVRSLVDTTGIKEIEPGKLLGLDEQLATIKTEQSFLAKSIIPEPVDSRQSSNYTDTSYTDTAGSRAQVQQQVQHIQQTQSDNASVFMQGAPPVGYPQAGFVPQQASQQNQVFPTLAEAIQGQARGQSQTERFIAEGKQIALQKYGKN
jgi:hypothetical protein